MFGEVDLKIKVIKFLEFNILILFLVMDIVIEGCLVIVMVQVGGIGVIYCNLFFDQQVEEVWMVKKFEFGMVVNLLVIGLDVSFQDVFNLMKWFGIFGVLVVENGGVGGQMIGKLVGILINCDVCFVFNFE